MKELGKVLIRQIVDREHRSGFRERRLHVLTMKNLWPGSLEQPGESYASSRNWVFGDLGKPEALVGGAAIERRRVHVQKIVLVGTLILRKAGEQLPHVSLVATRLTAQTVNVNRNIHR